MFSASDPLVLSWAEPAAPQLRYFGELLNSSSIQHVGNPSGVGPIPVWPVGQERTGCNIRGMSGCLDDGKFTIFSS